MHIGGTIRRQVSRLALTAILIVIFLPSPPLLLWCSHHVLDFRVFQFHVLRHRPLSAVGFPALCHLTDIFSLYFVGAASDAFLFVVGVIF